MPGCEVIGTKEEKGQHVCNLLRLDGGGAAQSWYQLQGMSEFAVLSLNLLNGVLDLFVPVWRLLTQSQQEEP